MPTLNQRGVVHIALILLLLAGLVAGVYLVQHPQIFKPKAAGGKVWLIDESNNNLPQKDEGVYEVPGQEIRIFIHQPTVWSPPGSSSRPQGRLPNLVTAAYAQQSGQCGNTWSGQPTQCADSSGKTAGGTQCSGPYLGAYTGCSGNTLYCYSCPGTTAGGTGSSGTTTNTGTTTDTSTPTITGASWDPDGSYLTISGSGFGNSQGTVYYSRGGSEQISSRSVSSWSAGSVKIGVEIPLGATRSVDNMISRDNYLKVCRIDGKCSGYWTLDKDRPKFKVDIPTAPKDAPQGQGAPAAPTQPEVAEATQEIRISSVIDYVKKDGACEGSEDPAKHCMSLTADNPDQRYTFAALLTKGYVGWWLANTTEEQNVYVGFISNKDTNYTESIKVRIVRPQPTARPTPAGGGAPPPAKSTLDTLAGSPDVMCIEGVAYYNDKSAIEPVKTGYGCVCKENDRDRPVVFITDKETGQDLVETGSSCTAPSAVVSPTPPAGGAKQGCPIEGACVNESGKTVGNLTCAGTDESNKYSCSNPAYPTCLTGISCKAPCPTTTGACVNEEGKTIANVTYAGTDESGKYYCSNPAYPTCLTGATPSKSAPSASPTPSPSISPSPAVSPSPTPPAEPETDEGNLDNSVAFRINVKNNSKQQVTVQKVNVEFSYGVDIWGFRLFPELINILTYDRGFREPVVLDPYKSISLIPGALCTDDEATQNKEKVVRVDYIMAKAPYIAKGKYQCGGSGTVTIP